MDREILKQNRLAGVQESQDKEDTKAKAKEYSWQMFLLNQEFQSQKKERKLREWEEDQKIIHEQKMQLDKRDKRIGDEVRRR